MVNVSLAIPADEGKMELAKKELGIQEFSECQWNQYGGPLDELRHYLPVGSEIEELNRFAWFLKEKVLDGTEQTVEKLKAALTAECPRNLNEAAVVVSGLSRYQIQSDFESRRIMPDGGFKMTMSSIFPVFLNHIWIGTPWEER